MILGITGKMGSGKTTVANYLLENDFIKINFKDALIKEIKNNFPDLLLEISKLYNNLSIDDLFLLKPPLTRKLLQNYGTNVRRNDDLKYWIKSWEKSIKEEKKNVVADDVRFLNEAAAVRKYGGKILKIVGGGINNSDHQSETEMDLIEPDYIIYNNSDIEELISRVNRLMKEVKPLDKRLKV